MGVFAWTRHRLGIHSRTSHVRSAIGQGDSGPEPDRDGIETPLSRHRTGLGSDFPRKSTTMTSFGTQFVLISFCAGAAFVACGKTSDNELGAASGAPGAGGAGEAGRAIQFEAGGVGNLDPGGVLGGEGGMFVSASVDCGQAGADSAGAAGAM